MVVTPLCVMSSINYPEERLNDDCRSDDPLELGEANIPEKESACVRTPPRVNKVRSPSTLILNKKRASDSSLSSDLTELAQLKREHLGYESYYKYVPPFSRIG